jgi:hypothetical protein
MDPIVKVKKTFLSRRASSIFTRNLLPKVSGKESSFRRPSVPIFHPRQSATQQSRKRTIQDLTYCEKKHAIFTDVKEFLQTKSIFFNVNVAMWQVDGMCGNDCVYLFLIEGSEIKMKDDNPLFHQ